MKYSVGYQMFSDDCFVDEIIKYKDSLSEVYFSWGDFPNGRNSQLRQSNMTSWQASEKQRVDLKKLTDNGVHLNLLFNAACYGKDSQSRTFFEKIGETVDFVQSNYILNGITTTSLLIARFVKDNFKNIDVRASVNMSIGDVEAMDYVSEYFDSFYLKRELNRDFNKIDVLKKWCDANGKKIYALANSGCLNNCSAHTFHDNLVSHEAEISQMDNGYEFSGICRKYLSKENNIYKFFDVTGFIRPEDIKLYEGIFDSVKLATRVNSNPFAVLKAYVGEQKYNGNILSLLEPNFASTMYPYIIDNSKIKSELMDGKLIYSNEFGAITRLKEDIYVN